MPAKRAADLRAGAVAAPRRSCLTTNTCSYKIAGAVEVGLIDLLMRSISARR